MLLVKKLFVLSLLLLAFHMTSNFASAEYVEQWNSTTPLPYQSANQTAFSYSETLYMAGGSAVTGQSKKLIQRAIIEADGSVSAWEPLIQEIPQGLIWHSTVVYENFVYILGGREENPGSAMSSVNKVYLGKIDTTGSIPLWVPTSPLPSKMALSSAVIAGNRIYISGEYSNFTNVRLEVYSSQIQIDGSLGQWTIVGSLPKPLFGHQMLEHNNYIYLVGGRNSSSVNNFDTYRAIVNSDGTIGPWETLAPLPFGVSRGVIVKDGPRIISIGGETNTGLTNKVFYTDIKDDGTLNPWQESANPLPLALCCGAGAINGEYVYMLGGHDLSGYFNTVYYSKLTPPAVPVDPSVSFEEFAEDIEAARDAGLIDNNSAHLLEVQLRNAEREYEKGKRDHTVKKVEQMKEMVDRFIRNGLDQDTGDIFLEDIEGLLLYIHG